jgi:hypothetical protein
MVAGSLVSKLLPRICTALGTVGMSECSAVISGVSVAIKKARIQ